MEPDPGIERPGTPAKETLPCAYFCSGWPQIRATFHSFPTACLPSKQLSPPQQFLKNSRANRNSLLADEPEPLLRQTQTHFSDKAELLFRQTKTLFSNKPKPSSRKTQNPLLRQTGTLFSGKPNPVLMQSETLFSDKPKPSPQTTRNRNQNPDKPKTSSQALDCGESQEAKTPKQISRELTCIYRPSRTAPFESRSTPCPRRRSAASYSAVPATASTGHQAPPC